MCPFPVLSRSTQPRTAASAPCSPTQGIATTTPNQPEILGVLLREDAQLPAPSLQWRQVPTREMSWLVLSSPPNQPQRASPSAASIASPQLGLAPSQLPPSPRSLPVMQQSALHSKGCRGGRLDSESDHFGDKCAISPGEQAAQPEGMPRSGAEPWAAQHPALLTVPHPLQNTPTQDAHPLLHHPPLPMSSQLGQEDCEKPPQGLFSPHQTAAEQLSGPPAFPITTQAAQQPHFDPPQSGRAPAAVIPALIPVDLIPQTATISLPISGTGVSLLPHTDISFPGCHLFIACLTFSPSLHPPFSSTHPALKNTPSFLPSQATCRHPPRPSQDAVLQHPHGEHGRTKLGVPVRHEPPPSFCQEQLPIKPAAL